MLLWCLGLPTWSSSSSLKIIHSDTNQGLDSSPKHMPRKRIYWSQRKWTWKLLPKGRVRWHRPYSDRDPTDPTVPDIQHMIECMAHHIYIGYAQSLNHVWLFATSWTVARQSMWFPRQKYWRGLAFLTLGDLPDPGIEPSSCALAGRFFTTSAAWEAIYIW